MPVTKPTTILDWASSATGIARTATIPPTDIIDGWAPAYKPPAQYLNYALKNHTSWIKWLNDINNQAFTWASLQTFSAGVDVSGGATIGGGAAVTGGLTVDTLNVTSNSVVYVGSGGGAPAFAGLWQNRSGQRKCLYYVDAQNRLNIEMNCEASDGGAVDHNSETIFTLPSGLRPLSDIVFPAFVNAANPPGLVAVRSTGTVCVFRPNMITWIGGNVWTMECHLQLLLGVANAP